MSNSVSIFTVVLLHPLTPYVLLINTTAPHALDSLLRLCLITASLLRNHLCEHFVDFSCHVARIAADVEVGFLLQKIIDQFAVLSYQVLDVNF